MTSLDGLRTFLEYADEMRFEIHDTGGSYLTDVVFCEFMRKAKDALGKTDYELAEMLDVSTHVVKRWLDGSNSPHRFMQLGAVNELIKAARIEEQTRSIAWP